MSKHKGRVPKIAKLASAHGTLVVDVEAGILVSVSHDVAGGQTRSRGDALAERRSQPPVSPNSKFSRN